MDEYNAPVVRVSDWVLTILVFAIPIVNLVMMFVWAFGGGTNPSKANFAKASLIWVLIGTVLAICFYVIFGAAMFAMMDEFSY
jgi:glycopeptide antibiotics resistance protein